MYNLFITFAHALKVFALSDIINEGVPLAANLRNQHKNVIARLATKSKWTVRVTQQVNNAK